VLRSNPLLADGDGRRLLGAQLADSIGVGVSAVALPWIVLDHSGSAGLAGLVYTTAVLPYVVFGLFAGALADQRSRKGVMVWAHAAQTVAIAPVPLLAFFGHVPIAVVLVAAFLVGVGRTYADAGAFGAIAEIVGPNRFVEGQAALTTAWAIGLVSGPALGGVLIARFGAPEAVTVEVAAFAVAALLCRSIRRPLAAPKHEVGMSLRAAAAEGVRVILHTPLLRLLSIVALAWNLVVTGAEALIVPFAREALDLDSADVGRLLAAGAIAGVLAGPIVDWVATRVGGLRLLAASIVVSGAASLGLAAAHGFWQALVAYVALTLAFWVSVTTMIGERQRHAPERLQARVGITGRMIAVGAMTVGGLIASGVAELVPLRTLYVGVGVATLLVAAWAVPALMAAQRTRPAVIALPDA
jgi:MFS family permease